MKQRKSFHQKEELDPVIPLQNSSEIYMQKKRIDHQIDEQKNCQVKKSCWQNDLKPFSSHIKQINIYYTKKLARG